MNQLDQIFSLSKTPSDFAQGYAEYMAKILGQLDYQAIGKMAEKMLAKGIYVVGFSYPVVPKGQARIRTQMSAGHTIEHVDKAVDAFIEVGKELGVI